MKRYAVKIPGKRGTKEQWVGSKTYSYRGGTQNRLTDFDHARVFNREHDASQIAAQERGVVVPLKLVEA